MQFANATCNDFIKEIAANDSNQITAFFVSSGLALLFRQETE